jgi:hypothetical protein
VHRHCKSNFNGQLNWVQSNPITGQKVTVQGNYTLAPLFARPDPDEFILDTSTDFLLFSAISAAANGA